MKIPRLFAVLSLALSTLTCDGKQTKCAGGAEGCACSSDAACIDAIASAASGGSPSTGGSTGAGGAMGSGGAKVSDASRADDAVVEAGVAHGPVDLSDCFGASTNPGDCNRVCAAKQQICVAGGCYPDSDGKGYTYLGYKTGFQCESSGSTVKSRSSCADRFSWDSSSMMVVRCCCAAPS